MRILRDNIYSVQKSIIVEVMRDKIQKNQEDIISQKGCFFCFFSKEMSFSENTIIPRKRHRFDKNKRLLFSLLSKEAFCQSCAKKSGKRLPFFGSCR